VRGAALGHLAIRAGLDHDRALLQRAGEAVPWRHSGTLERGRVRERNALGRVAVGAAVGERAAVDVAEYLRDRRAEQRGLAALLDQLLQVARLVLALVGRRRVAALGRDVATVAPIVDVRAFFAGPGVIAARSGLGWRFCLGDVLGAPFAAWLGGDTVRAGRHPALVVRPGRGRLLGPVAAWHCLGAGQLPGRRR